MVVGAAVGSPITLCIIDPNDEVELKTAHFLAAHKNQFFGIGSTHSFPECQFLDQVGILSFVHRLTSLQN